MKVFLLFTAALIIGLIAGYSYIRIKPTQAEPLTTSPTPQPKEFSIIDPPSMVLKGIITSMSGEVKWQSRVASESAPLLEPQTIQQGEDLETAEDGQMTVEFEDYLKIDILENSKVSFAQTLPANIVLAQTDGSVNYTKTGSVPVTIRSKRLLIDIQDGKTSVFIEEDKPIIKIRVESGSAKLAYNDRQYVSQIMIVEEDESVIYNDELRTVE